MRSLKTNTEKAELTLKEHVIKSECERDHLFFSRYFFKHRQNLKFIVNWHHRLICDVVQDIFEGKRQNVVITVSPGSSKTELVIINFIARGLAINPHARFLHLSYSDDLAALNSQSARDLIQSDEYQALWPTKISDDTKSKKRWNIEVNGKLAGGVYATSIAGQITGFRAGHMSPGFQGCILIDDPCKVEDAYSKSKLELANRKLLTTIKSRKANPDTPIILIMQRIAENDPVGFLKSGNVPGKWDFVTIPALIDEKYIQELDPKYRSLIPTGESERFSYWPYKERVQELLAMERGDGIDQNGSRVSRFVFACQYMQHPVAVGGNLIKGQDFKRYKILPALVNRNIYADTAQKTAERNDFSVFQCWGKGTDGKIYLLDQIRGKWEGPELRKRAKDFWVKHHSMKPELNSPNIGQLRKLKVEDKSSGTDIIQSLKTVDGIPTEAIQRNKDKLTRVLDIQPYIEAGQVCIPEEAPFINDFITECEAFTADDSHAHDDQVDPLTDAIMDMLSTANKFKAWEKLAQ